MDNKTIRRPAGSPKNRRLNPAGPNNVPKQWEVWVVDQDQSRANTHPPLPSDPDKSDRPFLVISTDESNSSGDDLVCLPISTKPYQPGFEVKLSAGDAGLREESYVKCYQPQTIHHTYFHGPLGLLSDVTKQDNIKIRLKRFLEFA